MKIKYETYKRNPNLHFAAVFYGRSFLFKNLNIQSVIGLNYYKK